MRAKAALAAVLLLFLAGTAQAQVKIHVKNPWPTMNVWEGMKVIGGVIAGPPGAAMSNDGDGWYSYTLAASVPFNATFHFALYSPAAYDSTGKTPDYASARGIYAGGAITGPGTGTEFTAGNIRTVGDEIWIIPSLTGPPVITITPQAKKVALLFNPWPAGAPTMKIGSATTFSTMIQSQDPNRCGWYVAPFNVAPFTVAFKSLFGSETYGLSGLGDAKAIDLTSYFSNSDTVFIYSETPGAPPKLTSAGPAGLKGLCSFNLAVTVRDFSKDHPDFDDAALARHDLATTGMVQNTLDKDGKPQVAKAFLQSDFTHWFRDNPTGDKLGNVTYCKDLPLKKSSKGLWGYNSLKDSPSHSYFPIDSNNTFGETGSSHYFDEASGTYPADPTNGKHNFNFCMEMHASFKYAQGQVFSFVGDDDTWAFIDGKLALDIGGPHPPVAGKIELDKLGLKEGNDYPFDFFFCERQPDGSDLLVETSIFFEQQQSTFYKRIDLGGGAYRYEIWEITQGDKSCGAVKGGDTALAKAEFRLSGPSVNPPELLAVGTKYGGVTVLPSMDQVTVDTNKITGLRPGQYTISFTTKSGFGTLKFTVPGTYGIEFSDKRPVKEILKTSVPVTIQASLSGTPDKRAETFLLKPSAGLTVYSDSAQTTPIAAGTVLTTDAATGTFKVYVTSAAAGTYKLDLYSGTGNLTLFDTFDNLTFIEQPKVAKPTATPPGMAFILPITVSLATSTTGADVVIWYTLDGTDPAVDGSGTTKKYAGPIPLSATTTIKAIAVKPGWLNSEPMTESYTYTPPLVIKKAYYKDGNADGMIETVVVEFEKDLPNLPDKLEFTINDAAGKPVVRTAAKGQIAYAAGSRSVVLVTLSDPFTQYLTAVPNPATSGKIFKQDNIPSLESNFPVDDSVPPVITRGTANPPDSSQPLERILVSLSEAVDLAGNPAAFVFKKDGIELAPGQVKIKGIETIGDRDYVILIDSTSDVFPVKDDFIALAPGQARDGLGNTPTAKTWFKLDGKTPAAKPVQLFVTFPNGKKDKPANGLEPQGMSVFIPIDKGNTALNGTALDGKCPGCYAGEKDNFVGPVFHILTPGPMRYEFKIFNTQGEFVASGTGAITPEDLVLMDKHNDASGMKYEARIVWTGRTDKGGKAATGAYILQSTLTTVKDPKTGAPPGHETKRVVFGLLRSFRG
jgi:fibro-slime domain-containing protein